VRFTLMDNYTLRGGAIASLVYSRDLVCSWVEDLDIGPIDEWRRKEFSYEFEFQLSKRVPYEQYDLGVVNILAKEFLQRYYSLGHRNFHHEFRNQSYLMDRILTYVAVRMRPRLMKFEEESWNTFRVFEQLWKPRLMLEMNDLQVQCFFEAKETDTYRIVRLGALCVNTRIYNACYPTGKVVLYNDATILLGGRRRLLSGETITDHYGFGNLEINSLYTTVDFGTSI